MSIPLLYLERDILTYNKGKMEPGSARIVYEVPLTVFLNENELATLICSPGGYEELAIGFLLSEGLVQNLPDIKEITCREDEGLIWVQTAAQASWADNFLRRHIASCCGKGRPSLYFANDAGQIQPVRSASRFSAAHIIKQQKII